MYGYSTLSVVYGIPEGAASGNSIIHLNYYTNAVLMLNFILNANHTTHTNIIVPQLLLIPYYVNQMCTEALWCVAKARHRVNTYVFYRRYSLNKTKVHYYS